MLLKRCVKHVEQFFLHQMKKMAKAIRKIIQMKQSMVCSRITNIVDTNVQRMEKSMCAECGKSIKEIERKHAGKGISFVPYHSCWVCWSKSAKINLVARKTVLLDLLDKKHKG